MDSNMSEHWGFVFFLILVLIGLGVVYILFSAVENRGRKKRWEEHVKWSNSPLDKSIITFSTIEPIYKKFSIEYMTTVFNREYLSIRTKQGSYTSKFENAVNELRRYYRKALFNDDDSVKDEVYSRLSNCKTNGEFNDYVVDYLKELLDNRGKDTNSNGYWEYIGNDTDRQRTVNNAQRQRILRRDNFTCQLCGVRGPGARPNPGDAVLKVDHRLPFSKGGTDDDSNLWTLCEECNYGKGNKYDDSKM